MKGKCKICELEKELAMVSNNEYCLDCLIRISKYIIEFQVETINKLFPEKENSKQ